MDIVHKLSHALYKIITKPNSWLDGEMAVLLLLLGELQTKTILFEELFQIIDHYRTQCLHSTPCPVPLNLANQQPRRFVAPHLLSASIIGNSE
jgi:hypothetical protein